MTAERIALGRAGEDAAAEFLSKRGYQVIARNVRLREGEVDIVARRGGLVAFVEVKTRRTNAFGEPREAVTYSKQSKIRGVALSMMAGGLHAREIRFDVVEVHSRKGSFAIKHFEGAF